MMNASVDTSATPFLSAIGRSWWVLLLYGIVAILFGAIALMRPMQAAARERMMSCFSLDRMAEGYARLFENVLAEPDFRPAPKSLDEFSIHPGLGPTWRRWIPEPVKKRLRSWAARVGMSP